MKQLEGINFYTTEKRKPMDKEQLLAVYNAVKDQPYRPSAEWKTAFDHFEASTGRHLGMGCHPCYGKVINQIIFELNEMGENLPLEGYADQYTRGLRPDRPRAVDSRNKFGTKIKTKRFL